MPGSINSRPLDALLGCVGVYEGRGINHDGETFLGHLEISTLPAQGGIALEFRATEVLEASSLAKPRVFHEERTWIALSETGKPQLFSINSNHPRVLAHDLKRSHANHDGSLCLVFGFGARDDRSSFREEIRIELHAGGAIGYHYAWGMPGGEFAERSGLVMKSLKSPAFLADPRVSVWHVPLEVSNLEASLEFYRGKLGFALLGFDECEEKRQAFVALGGGFTLELYEPKGARRASAREKLARPDHVAFECEELDEYRMRLDLAGVAVSELKRFDTGVATFGARDPDGMALEFFRGRANYERLISEGPAGNA